VKRIEGCRFRSEGQAVARLRHSACQRGFELLRVGHSSPLAASPAWSVLTEPAKPQQIYLNRCSHGAGTITVFGRFKGRQRLGCLLFIFPGVRGSGAVHGASARGRCSRRAVGQSQRGGGSREAPGQHRRETLIDRGDYRIFQRRIFHAHRSSHSLALRPG